MTELPYFLTGKSIKLLMFGGKGGNGKTTTAAAVAVRLARLDKGRKILIVSCDPAHSLGDSLDMEVGDEITPVGGIENLWAQEINAGRIDREFREKYRGAITDIIDRGTYFDKNDVNSFTDLQLPGLDEVMAVIEILKLLKEAEYDLIILDTAPTGHTIKLLAAPSMMLRWLGVFDMMMAKHRYMARHFSGKYVKDRSDNFIERLTADIHSLQSILKSDEAEFVPVTIPEGMAINETERLLGRLDKYSIPVRDIVVNRLEEGERECSFCKARISRQENDLREIVEKFGSYNLVKMPLFPHEIRGIDQLTEFGEVLAGKEHRSQDISTSGILSSSRLPGKRDSVAAMKADDRKVIRLYGGKGGTGKTVTAAASAIYMAGKYPGKKVLLFSTDPATSLSDCFGLKIGDSLTVIPGMDNLYAIEINAQKIYDNFINDYREKIEDAFSQFLGKGMDIQFDREVMTELLSLSPSGLDEIMALIRFVEYIEEERFDLYLLDTAATGHLVRFLELPELMRDWLKAIFKILIKYKEIVRLSDSAGGLIDLSRNIRKVQEILIDPERSEFIAVTIPEVMAFLETERLLDSLRRLNLHCGNMVINMVMPETDCIFCESRRRSQVSAMDGAGKSVFGGLNVVKAPLFSHDINGMDDLRWLCRELYHEGELCSV